MPRSDRPIEVLEQIGSSPYNVDLPREYNVSATFNVADLSLYYVYYEALPSLRANSSQEGEADRDQITEDPNELGGWAQESPILNQIKETMALIREHLFQPVLISPSTSSSWPVLVSLISHDQP